MKKPDLRIPTYPATLFTPWKDKAGSVFVSDFGPMGTEWHKRVWSDACDSGFWVKGRGEPKLFTLSTEERRDGEVRSWTMRSADGYVITVFNT